MENSDTSDFRYDDRVVVITGAGGGIGRAYALAFAEQGAKVVANDLGVGVEGAKKDENSRAADNVVMEIKESGGEAVANYSAVESGDEIIEQAMDSYGHVDVLINNAGIVFPVPFSDMTFEQWGQMLDVHLNGSFKCSKAAWPYMQAREYGRIIMTASPVMYGAEYLAHYSSAKAAMPGLANSIAAEGARFNIHCNTIVPTAMSRMIENGLPEADLSKLSIDPVDIAQLALWLCHENSSESGGIYEVGGGFIARMRYAHSKGVKFENAGFSAHDIVERKSDINNFDAPFFPADSAEMTSRTGLNSTDLSVFGEKPQ